MSAGVLAPNLAHRSLRHARRARSGTDRGSAPVRRGSPGEPHPEKHCRFMPNGEKRLLFRMLKAYAADTRGARGVAELTASSLHVGEVMAFTLMDRTTGLLDPAYCFIAARARRAYQTAVDAVAQLEALKVLVVQRRARRGDDPSGPRWVQDTNLYRFEIPKWLRDWWEARRRRIDDARARYAPEDHSAARTQAAADNAEAERTWFAWQSEQRRSEALSRDLARDVRGPGARAWRAGVDARAKGAASDSA